MVVGNTKIFCLKFADDVVIEADSADGLRDLEKYCRKKKMIVNAEKTKVMIFRKGGCKRKGEKWFLKSKGDGSCR